MENKEVNFSEALRYIQQFINEMTDCMENPKQYAKNYDKEIFYKYKYTFESVVEPALIKAQEKEQAFNIIMQLITSLDDTKLIPYVVYKAIEERSGKDSKEAKSVKDLLEEWI